MVVVVVFNGKVFALNTLTGVEDEVAAIWSDKVCGAEEASEVLYMNVMCYGQEATSIIIMILGRPESSTISDYYRHINPNENRRPLSYRIWDLHNFSLQLSLHQCVTTRQRRRPRTVFFLLNVFFP